MYLQKERSIKTLRKKYFCWHREGLCQKERDPDPHPESLGKGTDPYPHPHPYQNVTDP
jgi:hypothetical protein